MSNPFRRQSTSDLSPPAKFVAFLLLLGWSFVVLFPIYWLFVTSFKTPYQVDKGPFYIPFVDFQPTLDAWHYILVELGNDTIRPYVNTVIVGLSSSVIALIIGLGDGVRAGPLHLPAEGRADRAVHLRGALAFVGMLLGGPPVLMLVAAARGLRDPRPDRRPAVHAGPSPTATSRSG